MSIEIKIKVGSEGMTGRRRERIQKALEAAGFTAEGSWKSRVQGGPKTGRIYVRGEQKVGFIAGSGYGVTWVEFTAHRGVKTTYHQASAPGESPATDTGHYVNSIETRVGELEVTVVGTAPYILDLELGTPGGKIAARPAARPAFEDGHKVLIDELNKP